MNIFKKLNEESNIYRKPDVLKNNTEATHVEHWTTKETYEYKVKQAKKLPLDEPILLQEELYYDFYNAGLIDGPYIAGREIHLMNPDLNPFY